MRHSKPDYDQPLKWMAESDPDGFLQLIAHAQVRWIRSLSPELPARRRQADLVWEVEFSNDQRGIIHIELQTKPEEFIEARITEYSLRLWMRDKLPVYSIVIFFRPTGSLPASPFNWSWKQDGGYGYPFEVIRLWEFQAEQLLQTEHYMLWPLAGVMGKEVSSETFGKVAQEIIHTPLPRPQIADLIGGLTAIGGLRLSKEAIAEALRRNPMFEDILKESSFKDVMADLLRPELEAQLRPELEAKGMRKFAQAALEARFGPLEADMQAALNTADEATLKILAIHISTDTLEEMRGRLGLK